MEGSVSASPHCYHDLPLRRGSSSTTDLNTTASTSDTGSEWGSGSDDQEPDVERTTALIRGEAMLHWQYKKAGDLELKHCPHTT